MLFLNIESVSKMYGRVKENTTPYTANEIKPMHIAPPKIGTQWKQFWFIFL